MAGSVNKVIIIGRLGKDPEIRSFGDGGKVANMSVATSETWKDRASGERKERTEWNKVVCKDDRITDVIERFVKKGTVIYLEGKLETRKYTNQSGAEVYTTEVVIPKFGGVLTLLDSKRDDGSSAAEPTREPHPGKPGGYPQEPKGGDFNDEIPF